MQIEVGLKAGDLLSLYHGTVTLASPTGLAVQDAHSDNSNELICQPGQHLSLRASSSNLVLSGAHLPHNLKIGGHILISPGVNNGLIELAGQPGAVPPAKPAAAYCGRIKALAQNDKLMLVLLCDLETYVQGVLNSEVPAGFQLEAMKAQAILARTYALNPRVSHAPDGFMVCDSYLCCQAFNGAAARLTPLQRQAITTTSNQILVFDGKPALALFSACAGGHTESYENCFSDPVTQAFPPPAIPYLKGVPEGALPAGYPGEKAMRELFALAAPATCDAWSQAFRWKMSFSSDALEGHMHHVIEELRKDPQFSPFILPPQSSFFGHIERVQIIDRGVAGTAKEMIIHTNKGPWTVKKELTIRNVFGNTDLKVKRLKSARVFFDHTFDRLGLLSKLEISGFGSGHGVGLQQTGAQGLALKGRSCEEILCHYYRGAAIATAPEKT